MPLGVVLDFWVEELKLGKPLSVEVVVTGSETHFGLAEDEREETVLFTPFGCCEMAHEDRKLIEEVSQIVESGLPHHCIERDGLHLLSRRFGDGGHGHRDRRHLWAVCAQKNKLTLLYSVLP